MGRQKVLYTLSTEVCDRGIVDRKDVDMAIKSYVNNFLESDNDYEKHEIDFDLATGRKFLSDEGEAVVKKYTFLLGMQKADYDEVHISVRRKLDYELLNEPGAER